MHISPQTYVTSTIIGAMLGYALARNMRNKYGRATFNWPEWAWMLFGAFFGAVITALVLWLGGRKIVKAGTLAAKPKNVAIDAYPVTSDEVIDQNTDIRNV